MFEKTFRRPEPEETIYFHGTYAKWRRTLFWMNALCALVILLTEIVMYFVFRAENLFLQPVPVYLFRFLILPTVLNGLNLAVGYFLLHTKGVASEAVLNYVPVIQLTMICFLVSTVHHVFSVTFCTFCFPIFISTMFNNRGMTRWITGISIVCLTMAQMIGPWLNDVSDLYLVPEYFVALVALIGANIVCSVLTMFHREKDRIIAESHRRQLDMRQRLYLDQKTGLYGSTAFHDHLFRAVETAGPEDSLGLAVLDIDDFKKVNDTCGHAKGDTVILKLAGLMKIVCGDRHFLARFGGEEFAVVFTEGGPEEWAGLAEKLRDGFSKLKFEFIDEPVTVSVGLACWRVGWTAEALFDRADAAMYQAKAAGKNRVVIYK